MLSGLSATRLGRSDIDLGSTLVTDATGAITYLNGADYTLTETGNRVEIRRTLAGRIPDGGTVLVDYSLVPQKPLNYTITTTGARAQLDLFKHWSLYAGMTNITPSGGAESDDRLEVLTEAIVGTKLYWGKSQLTLEHVNHDSTQSPYVEDRATLMLGASFGRIHTVSANAEYRHRTLGLGLKEEKEGAIDRGDRQKETITQEVSASYSLRPRRWPSLSLTVGRGQLQQDDEVSAHDFGNVELIYRLRATEFRLKYKINTRTDELIDDTSHYLFFSIIRSF